MSTDAPVLRFVEDRRFFSWERGACGPGLDGLPVQSATRLFGPRSPQKPHPSPPIRCTGIACRARALPRVSPFRSVPSSPMSTTQPTASSSSNRSDTAERILDLAQERIQRRGYNAVSYGDLADELDLTTAAIHYHFPSKTDLVQTLVQRYRQASAEHRAAIRADHDTLRARLEGYADLYTGLMTGGGLCLCGVLASDAPTLPDEVRAEVRQFFVEQEDWLAALIAEGLPDGPPLHGCDTAQDAAELVLATMQGAMLTTPHRDPTAYRQRIQPLIDSIV